MSQSSLAAGRRPLSPAEALLWAGLAAGTLDIAAAFVSTYLLYGRGPEFVLRFIASGVFGRPAFSGGASMAALGLLFHFAIAFFWAGVFVAAYRQVGILGRRAVLSGLLFGLLIWVVMNLAVLPLAHAPRSTFSLRQTPLSIGYVVFCVGLTISLVVNRVLGPAGVCRRAF